MAAAVSVPYDLSAPIAGAAKASSVPVEAESLEESGSPAAVAAAAVEDFGQVELYFGPPAVDVLCCVVL